MSQLFSNNQAYSDDSSNSLEAEAASWFEPSSGKGFQFYKRLSLVFS